jgi:hypothetical protein
MNLYFSYSEVNVNQTMKQGNLVKNVAFPFSVFMVTSSIIPVCSKFEEN